MTSTKQWNAVRALMYGAIVGALFTLVDAFGGEHIGSNAEEVIGSITGGMLGGAAMFGLVAVVRNFFVKL